MLLKKYPAPDSNVEAVSSAATGDETTYMFFGLLTLASLAGAVIYTARKFHLK